MKNYSGVTFFLVGVLFCVTVVDNIILRGNVEDLQVDIQSIMISASLTEGQMLMRSVGDYVIEHYKHYGSWPNNEALTYGLKSPKTQQWSLSSVATTTDGNLAVTLHSAIGSRALIGVVHLDGRIIYPLPGVTPIPQRAG